MKKKFLFIILALVLVFTMTGCGSKDTKGEDAKKDSEVSLAGAYILDYNDVNYRGSENKANMIVVLDIKPKKAMLFEDATLSMTIDGTDVKGKEYENLTNYDRYFAAILYDSYKSVEANKSTKKAYVFEMEKYLYKDNDSYKLKYNIGTKKGEYSYVLEDELVVKKNSVKEVEFLEDMVKDVYKDNANDALMIMSLKFKLFDIFERAEAVNSLDLLNYTNYGCYSTGAVNKGKKLNNYFANGEVNDVSITNSLYLGTGANSEYIKYNIPALNYDTLEKYFPGIKEPLTSLSDKTNEFAKGLMSVNQSGAGECYRGVSYNDLRNEAQKVIDVMNK